MKLKRHREDVRDLKLMDDNHIQAIAKRYQRLIHRFEQQFNRDGITDAYVEEYGGFLARKILEDAKE